MEVTALAVASRFNGMAEIPGPTAHPFISWSLSLVGMGKTPSDEIPNCSAFMYAIAWILDLPRPTKNPAAARSWLTVGTPVDLDTAKPGFDVVVFKRGSGYQPGPEVLNAAGHVALFVGLEGDDVRVLGGNQGNQVNVSRFRRSQVLGVRRLY